MSRIQLDVGFCRLIWIFVAWFLLDELNPSSRKHTSKFSLHAEGTIFEPFFRKRPSTIVPQTVEPKNVCHEYTCNCTNNYIGSTKRCLDNRVEEHIQPTSSQKPSSITFHRRYCTELENNFKIINHGSDVVDTRIKEGLPNT